VGVEIGEGIGDVAANGDDQSPLASQEFDDCKQ